MLLGNCKKCPKEHVTAADFGSPVVSLTVLPAPPPLSDAIPFIPRTFACTRTAKEEPIISKRNCHSPCKRTYPRPNPKGGGGSP